MTDHAADSRFGPALYIAAAATLAAIACAVGYLASLLLVRTQLTAVPALAGLSLIGLVVTAPLAIGASLLMRCRACDKLVLPVVYDGKSLFAAKSPSAAAILGTALAIVRRRRAPCPHCGVEAHV